MLHSGQQPLSSTDSTKPTAGKDFWLAKMKNLTLQEHSVKPGRQQSVPLEVFCLARPVREVEYLDLNPRKQF